MFIVSPGAVCFALPALCEPPEEKNWATCTYKDLTRSSSSSSSSGWSYTLKASWVKMHLMHHMVIQSPWFFYRMEGVELHNHPGTVGQTNLIKTFLRRKKLPLFTDDSRFGFWWSAGWMQKGCWQTLPMMVCTDVENERPERVTVSKDYQSLK